VLAAAAPSGRDCRNRFRDCLYQLMLSPADRISPLPGTELIKRKVLKLAACCGVDPNGYEWNFINDYLMVLPLLPLGLPRTAILQSGCTRSVMRRNRLGAAALCQSGGHSVLFYFHAAGWVRVRSGTRPRLWLGRSRTRLRGAKYWQIEGDGTMIVNSADNGPSSGRARDITHGQPR